MKYQVLFSLKNNEKVFKTCICCSCEWCLKGSLREVVTDKCAIFLSGLHTCINREPSPSDGILRKITKNYLKFS